MLQAGGMSYILLGAFGCRYGSLVNTTLASSAVSSCLTILIPLLCPHIHCVVWHLKPALSHHSRQCAFQKSTQQLMVLTSCSLRSSGTISGLATVSLQHVVVSQPQTSHREEQQMSQASGQHCGHNRAAALTFPLQTFRLRRISGSSDDANAVNHCFLHSM